MLRSLVRLTATVAFAMLLPAVPHAASTGLQYDEIDRVISGATPPPPGNFSADAAAISSPAPVAASAAPRRHGFNLGALAGGLMNGNVAGAVAGGATDALVGNALDAQVDRVMAQTGGALAGMLHGLLQGRIERHSFYLGWERVDDLAASTATITKCDLHQIIRLDLTKKTYSMIDTADRSALAETTAEPPKRHTRVRDTVPPEAPGTAVASFTNVVKPLGAKRLEGLDTAGFDNTSTFALSQATGSCRNGNFAFHSKAYFTRFPAPGVSCPMTAVPAVHSYPREPLNFVASGGCRPTFVAHASGPAVPAQNLSLYQTIGVSGAAGSPSPQASPAPGFVFLTERGNVHSLTSANAGLFEIPPDFVKDGGR